MFFCVSPNNTLANISSYTVYVRSVIGTGGQSSVIYTGSVRSVLPLNENFARDSEYYLKKLRMINEPSHENRKFIGLFWGKL